MYMCVIHDYNHDGKNELFERISDNIILYSLQLMVSQ